MAWDDVPAKLARYASIEYGGEENARRLVVSFNVGTILELPEEMHEEFEQALDYRLGACENLVRSKAIDPRKMLP